VFGVAFFMLLSYVAITEAALSEMGFRTTVSDSEARWLKERKRASELGTRALILVGASRIQLDIDLSVLRKRTGLEPVQLAIDGSSYVPVLQGLAKDQSIRGTVVLDLMPSPVSFEIDPVGRSQPYQADYETSSHKEFSWPNYHTSEAWLDEVIRSRLINFADSGRPWDALVNRLTNPNATPQYLLTFPDRSRQADYQNVPMPDFYLQRVLRHVGNPAEIDPHQPTGLLAQQLEGYVRRLKPTPENAQNEKGLADLERAVSAIQSRHGQVIIISMPTSGLVQESDSIRFPRSLYWDKVVATTSAKTIHWQDHPSLSGFVCPDGSHLDKRDSAAFTRAFVLVAGLDRP
jgi:hypothetical protein